ncbi:response regulator [Deinococcus deserti]|uniref:Putative response regulator, CheY n=1 Tax=Deinococcus deserti (strain DSM 17065 / CIP 109153 / LMG 22923 / VCD115) TaxID=546414 RepID=C1D1X6_DEIDV|nr:response regulator [Deinococcus deserti]ACO47415.1 putative response regulator, CheY [Deinococcus deserti VCD115]
MFNVLMVEDNAADVVLMEVALEEFRPNVTLYVVNDGVEALQFVRGEGLYADAPRPHLILLDGNTPRKSAVEVLNEVRHDAGTLDLPVVVFSSSSVPADVERSLQAGANAYLTKPVGLSEFTDAVHSTLDFWWSKLNLSDT